VTARDTSGEITGTNALITYAYDSRSRRISRSVGVSPTSTTYYLYDGWNVVAEYTCNGVDPPALSRTHTWGTDLSGTMQGVGGVGGLLAVRVHGDEYPGNYYPTFDGNGNVSEYLTDTGVRKAHYEYDPFGSDITPVTAGGDLHGFFTYRFSTKPFDDISGWFYYGYRYYDPVTGRWPSRDPIGESGGVNLYNFVVNSPADMVDMLGLKFIWEKDLELGDEDLGPEHWEYTRYGVDLGWTCRTSVYYCCSATEGWITVPNHASEWDGWALHYRNSEFPDPDLLVPSQFWVFPDVAEFLNELSDDLYLKAFDKVENLARINKLAAKLRGFATGPDKPIKCEGSFRWHGVLPNGDVMMFDRSGPLNQPSLAYENTY